MGGDKLLSMARCLLFTQGGTRRNTTRGKKTPAKLVVPVASFNSRV
jgi:hypothetical protein